MSQKRRKSKKNKRKNLLINILAGFLILLSLALIFNSKIRDIFMILNTNKYQVSQVTKENIEKNQETEGNFDFNSVKALSSEAVLSAQWNSQQLPVIGGIAIPELEMNLPIFKGLDNVNLFYGAGTMKANQVMGEGNYSLASHRIFTGNNADKKLFSPLARAKKGMKIYLTDKEKVYTYEIDEVKIVTPDRVDLIEDREGINEITLVTCEDANAAERIIVKGNWTETKSYSDTPSNILDDYFHCLYNRLFYLNLGCTKQHLKHTITKHALLIMSTLQTKN